MIPKPMLRSAPVAFLTLMLGACGEALAPTAPIESATFAAHGSARPVILAFSKCIVDPAGVWQGSVSGALTGDLTTVLTGLDVRGAVWHVDFDWIISAGANSFRAELSGILNTQTGHVVMNGRVAEGYLEGARVHEEGRLTDPAASCFEGTIQLMPATAR
jgi:hypothetical protein